jgi:hypothetical protein
MRIFWYFTISVSWAVAAWGQAIVEHSLATAGASAAATGVRGTGKSIGGVFGSLTETLDKAGTAKEKGRTPAPSAVTTRPGPPKQSAKPVPASKPIDPSQVTEGLDGAEVIQRFGEPVLRFSETRNSHFVEKLWYNTTTSDQLEIRLIDGKVALVHPPASR